MSNPKVFISYSWAVQEQVIELANRLISDGIDVVIDVYDLKDGQDKYVFMEQSVNDESIQKVLMICDKTYCDKANNRNGGVGDEIVIISPEIYGNVKQEKFIPIVFERDEEGKEYLPQFIKSRIYIDLSPENSQYEENYDKLLRNIYEKPLYRKPALGKKPEWLEAESVDLSAVRNVIKKIKGYNGNDTRKEETLLRQAQAEFINAAKNYTVLRTDENQDKEFLKTLEQTKVLRDLYVDFCESVIYFVPNVYAVFTAFFESMYNSLHFDNVTNANYLEESLYDFLIMEFFINTTAILLYYEKYADIYKIITHTYFLNLYGNKNSVSAVSYFEFRKYIDYLEGDCKLNSSRPNLITLTGELLSNREKKPILTTVRIQGSRAQSAWLKLYLQLTAWAATISLSWWNRQDSAPSIRLSHTVSATKKKKHRQSVPLKFRLLSCSKITLQTAE